MLELVAFVQLSLACCKGSLFNHSPASLLLLLMRASKVVSRRSNNNHLVDPASSHMLVSKIKPCMSKYKPLYGETANGSLKQL